ncbi:MAG: hypothetical protein FE78DRAFT_150348 [Acidomyces sp. 'richmondensis']|nr:MAG: hypothetical protein FE78DRAFT_150348 [Acidomyces sp. 'richmondensis']
MSENRARALRGELYYAFTQEMVNARRRCRKACERYNNSGEVSRRKQVELWRDIIGDNRPMPPQAASEAEDEELFADEPWIESPIAVDYGTNIVIGKNVFINFNCTILDTCKVSIGDRCLLASNVSLFSGTHPLDPEVRNGTKGPELGAEIHIEEDCWLGGNVTVLPGVRIGKGSTVGAGSVVTKDVPPFTVVAGNPARKIRDVPQGTKAEHTSGALAALARDQQQGSQAKPLN